MWYQKQKYKIYFQIVQILKGGNLQYLEKKSGFLIKICSYIFEYVVEEIENHLVTSKSQDVMKSNSVKNRWPGHLRNVQ